MLGGLPEAGGGAQEAHDLACREADLVGDGRDSALGVGERVEEQGGNRKKLRVARLGRQSPGGGQRINQALVYGCGPFLSDLVGQLFAQPGNRFAAVLVLRAPLRCGDDQTGCEVSEANRRVGFVAVLAAGAAGAITILLTLAE